MSTSASKSVAMTDRLSAWKRRKQPTPAVVTSRPRQRKPNPVSTDAPPPPPPPQQSKVSVSTLAPTKPVTTPVAAAHKSINIPRQTRSSLSPSTPPLPTRYADVFDAGEFIAGLSTPFAKPRAHAHIIDDAHDTHSESHINAINEDTEAVEAIENAIIDGAVPAESALDSSYDVAMSASSSVVIVSAVTAAPSTARRFGADTFISPVRRSTRLHNFAGALTTPVPLTSQRIDTGALMSDANVIKAIGAVGAVMHNAALSNTMTQTPRNKRTRSPQDATQDQVSTQKQIKGGDVDLTISPVRRSRRATHKLAVNNATTTPRNKENIIT